MTHSQRDWGYCGGCRMGERAKVWFGPGSMTSMGDMARE